MGHVSVIPFPGKRLLFLFHEIRHKFLKGVLIDLLNNFESNDLDNGSQRLIIQTPPRTLKRKDYSRFQYDKDHQTPEIKPLVT